MFKNNPSHANNEPHGTPLLMCRGSLWAKNLFPFSIQKRIRILAIELQIVYLKIPAVFQ